MSAPDSRPALPIHLPFDSISPSFSKNSPCVFQVLGYYLTSLGEILGGWLLCTYFRFTLEATIHNSILCSGSHKACTLSKSLLYFVRHWRVNVRREMESSPAKGIWYSTTCGGVHRLNSARPAGS